MGWDVFEGPLTLNWLLAYVAGNCVVAYWCLLAAPLGHIWICDIGHVPTPALWPSEFPGPAV
eukprot:2143306-Karenia_brevis.AAC.1